ncbi:MAG: UPF0182 family protein [Candidatus Bathyarchaeota archaeon]
MERRTNILPMILFLLFLLTTLSTMFEIPPELYFIIIIGAIGGFVVYSRRGGFRARGVSLGSEESRLPFQPRQPGIGRWIIIPIAIIGVVILILFENWWLDVSIFKSMYFNKANIDWWKITFLDNYYFYFCIIIGLMIALSDPRIIIEKDAQGKRRFFFHSKFWAAINAIIGQVSEYQGSPFSINIKRGPFVDKLSFKRGILWKLLEFLIGTIVIGPIISENLALTFLMISRWIETQGITWIDFILNSVSVFYTRLFIPESITGIDLGNWLIANSPTFEFLLWSRTLISIIIGIWSVRLVIAAILEILEQKLVKFFRNIIGVGFLLLIPYVLQIPTLAFDVTTPFFVRTILIVMGILLVLLVFLSLQSGWVQLSISRIFRNRIILFFLIIVISGSLLYGPVVVAVQYAPTMGGNYEKYLWEPKYLPNVIYTRWATGLESIKEDNINSAINTGTNLEILRKIRVFNDVAATLRLKPSIGVNWMDFPQTTSSVDIVFSNGREYWLAPLTIVLPTVGTEDQWRSSRMLITHSERILAIDAATGEIVPISTVYNLTNSYSLYYGEGGLFVSSPQVYIDVRQDILETHLSDYGGPISYSGNGGGYDYVLDGFERLWFFSGIYGREQLRWDFGRGDWGPIKMLYMRDINQRLSQILLPGMTIDDDPYIVSDGKNIYYLSYIYINRDMPTEYLDYPTYQDKYWRLFATVLINAYDGSIQGYLLNQNETNYVEDFYRGIYPQWNQEVPIWLQSQLRYPEFLFEKQIDSYNLYHVSDSDFWQRGTDFFELTTNAVGAPIEDVRFVSFYLNGTTYWAAIRLVEQYRGAGKNLAGMYVALNGETILNPEVFLLRTGSIAVIGPQTALDTINNYGPTRTQLTLQPNWQAGNILLYVINNRPYYFVPYYGGTGTTLAPAMIVTVDALSQKVGYYIIVDSGNAKEVGLASEKAYFNLIGATVELPAEARKNNVLNEVEKQGYTLKTPQSRNIPLEYREYLVNYYSESDWATTNSTLSAFISTWVIPFNVDPVLTWETVVSNVKYLNLGVFIVDRLELHYITIAYG